MQRMLHVSRYSSWFYQIALLIVLIVGIFASTYTYRETTRALQQSLLENASAIAYAIDPHELELLTGGETDLGDPVYQGLKARLEKARSARGDVRFIYFTGYRDGEPFFYVDSEPDTSEDYSPPGQIFYEGSEAFRAPIIGNDSTPHLDEIYEDRWGIWLTAVVPILNTSTGSVFALMGVDVDASEYYRTAWFYTLAPIGVTFFVLLLLSIGYLVRRREQRLLDFKSELVSIASHEIRTPLTGISWIAEQLLKNPGGLTESVKNDIRLIASQSRDLILSVSDFLDLAILEELSPRTVAGSSQKALPLIQEVVNGFMIALPEKSLSIAIDPSLSDQVQVAGDATRLKRLFANLISNAIKYSKQGGTITIGCTAGSRRVTFSIKDEGIGILERNRDHIFSGNISAEDASRSSDHGAGLGLRYVRQVANIYGGKVWVESAIDKGSTFFVELPA